MVPDPFSYSSSSSESLSRSVERYLSVPRPGIQEAFASIPRHACAFAEFQGERDEQEDALLIEFFSEENMTPLGDSARLSADEIGHRLRTAFHVLQQMADKQGGAVASTTIYNGDDRFITATLGDSLSFAAVYDRNNTLLKVVRLNRRIHNLDDVDERRRVLAAGGIIEGNRVLSANGMGLAVTRALGDKNFPGVCADADIDIISMKELADSCQCSIDEIGCVRLIITCDGYSEPCPADTRAAHEAWLKTDLEEIQRHSPVPLSEGDLAMALAKSALHKGSEDNVSVIVYTIKPNSTQAVLAGVFDGHASASIATMAAESLGNVFLNLCAMTRSDYAQHALSMEKGRSRHRPRHNTPASAASSSTRVSPRRLLREDVLAQLASQFSDESILLNAMCQVVVKKMITERMTLKNALAFLATTDDVSSAVLESVAQVFMELKGQNPEFRLLCAQDDLYQVIVDKRGQGSTFSMTSFMSGQRTIDQAVNMLAELRKYPGADFNDVSWFCENPSEVLALIERTAPDEFLAVLGTEPDTSSRPGPH
ncbi:PP2C family serine/threonine-protein phosphatase [Legionella sp. CNM-4043-24]|uniref:PP2C family serine/threonine-protein phosphatase n=1 Tax=Legionella sp. CNM-4043-24 TaxID=3421646 RepID=UPI00403B09D6